MSGGDVRITIRKASFSLRMGGCVVQEDTNTPNHPPIMPHFILHLSSYGLKYFFDDKLAQSEVRKKIDNDEP
jgi:hypothetical protein